MAFDKLKITIAQQQALGDRPNQEDAMSVSNGELPDEKGILAVLCDGMGGMTAGKRFSHIGVTEMQQRFEVLPPMEDICRELMCCLSAAQAAAENAQKDYSDRPGGSTLVAVLIRDGRCAFISMGDSRIYLLRGGGLIQLTRDQVLGDLLDERAALGVIAPEDALRNIRRNTLTNALGISGSISCDRCIESFALRAGDRIALVSDGVYGTLIEDRLCRLMAQDAESAAQQIIDEVLLSQRYGQDNCSVLIVAVDALDSAS